MFTYVTESTLNNGLKSAKYSTMHQTFLETDNTITRITQLSINLQRWKLKQSVTSFPQSETHLPPSCMHVLVSRWFSTGTLLPPGLHR